MTAKLKPFMKLSEFCVCFANILTSCDQYDIIFDVIILRDPNFESCYKWVIPGNLGITGPLLINFVRVIILDVVFL